jgi:NADH-quinone oxidoreductase subunit F
VIPGGSSVPFLTADECRTAVMDYEGIVAAGSMLGSGGVIVLDDQVDMVRQIARLARFYAHESCAQCSQCREGTAWTTKILERIRDGQGTAQDLDTLLSIADGMSGKTICVLSDSCATPVVSGLKKFRHEFEAKLKLSPNVVSFAGAASARGGSGMAARVAASLGK